MSFSVADPFVIPEDIVLTSVGALPPTLRSELDCEDGDFAVTRPHSRTPSRVVDASTADLLRQFTEAKPITEAIIAFSRAAGSDPEKTLVDAFPVLQRLVNDGLLVLADSSTRKRIEAGFSSGDRIDGFVITDLVQVLADSEVYRAETADRRAVAVKLARADASGVRRALARETAILRLLDRTASPRLVGDGTIDGRAYVAIEWLEGSDVATTGRRLVARGEHERAFELGGRLLDAYAAIHARGVLHGDVHPRNAVVSGDGKVRLIDFGLADSAELPAELRPRQRGGVEFFLEPEFARARLEDRRPPRLDAVGEQYSVAALVYLVLTGHQYLRFSPRKEAMRRQIVDEAPLAFTDAGLAPSPALEAVLRRGLAKNGHERFASVGELRSAFRAAIRADRRRRKRIARDALVNVRDDLISVLVEKVSRGSPEVLSAPKASVTYGAAGLAYALMRLARARQDADLLGVADVWSERAVALSENDDGFYDAEFEIEPETVGRSSPYHTLSGVHWVRACVSHAMADVVGFAEACQNVVLASQELSDNPDLTLGRAGTLVAYGSLLELSHTVPLADTAFLRQAGDELAGLLSAYLESRAPLADERTLRFLGIAHGWAGIVYALLRWREAGGSVAPTGLERRLDELAGAAEPTGVGLRWPRQRRNRSRPADFVPSWCNGSAGFVHLWLTAERVLDDAGYRELATGAAHDALGPMETGIDLCCGLAGRAYALLALHRVSGDERWLREARNLALRGLLPASADRPFALSLYKGVVGPAVLGTEVASPATASMPLFEREGWVAPSG